MSRNSIIRSNCCAAFILWLAIAADAQITVYNNFGPDHGGWDYTYSTGWTVAGVNVPGQYGVEQAMSFTSTADGVVSDLWVAFFAVPYSTFPDTVTIKLARNPSGVPPDSAEVMERWVIFTFASWTQWTPPIHLVGNGLSRLQTGEDYWLWAVGGATTWCGWCLNTNMALTCRHTLRREGEDWLPVADETASAFRVDVNPTAPVSVTLTPAWTPIQIPSSGGSFQFDAALANTSGSAQTFQAWIKVQLPNLSWYGPILGPLTLTLSPQQSLTRRRTQTIPASAPAGLYTYRGWVGTYPEMPQDSSSFTFTKSANGTANPEFGEWICAGESFPSEQPQTALIPSGLQMTASPNPFNATTVASFKLQVASHVSLKVYDTAGRLVAILVDGWRDAGEHRVTFDGSKPASGVYLARLEAGEVTQMQKLVLLK
jgi:hypothetical protein